MELEYFSLVTNGRFKQSITEKIREELYNFEGKNVKIVISEDNSSKETRAFNFLHKTFDNFAHELCDLTGDVYTPEKIKEMCKLKFGVEKTSKLKHPELTILILKIRTWALDEFGIFLPEPQKNY